jgi:hypothetical protein
VTEIDEDARISLQRDVAQDLGELACGELAGSPRAGDHLGQAFLSEKSHLIPLLDLNDPRQT